MKIKIIKFKVSEFNTKGECIDEYYMERVINDFCEGKDIVDIKTNTNKTRRHNNEYYDEVFMVYTILYK